MYRILTHESLARKTAVLMLLGLMAIQTKTYSQSNLPAYVPSFRQESSPYCTFTTLSNIGYSWLFIFAPNGEPLFYRRVDASTYDFKLLPSGNMSYFDYKKVGFVILDSMYREVDLIQAKNDYPTDPHELRMAEDGGYFLFGLDKKIVDMSQIVEGGNADALLTEMVIQKLDADKNLVFEWKTDEHFQILDSYEKLKADVIDLVHFNAIEIDTDTTIIVSSRQMSELTKINLNTGAITWRLGGKNNDFTFNNFTRIPSGQHTIRRKNDSTYTVFDNGLFYDEKYSMGIEFTMDEDSLIVEKIYEFRHNPDIYSNFAGNLQNLDNGNTLVYWGYSRGDEIGGRITEYDQEKTIVEEGKFINCKSPTYRVQKYRWEPKLFSSNSKKIDFPSTAYGSTSTESIVLSNHSDETLVINEFVNSQGVFIVDKAPISLAPGSDAMLDVVFMPNSNESIEDILTIRSKDERQGIAIQVYLSGTGHSYTGYTPQPISEDFSLCPNPYTDIVYYRSTLEINSIYITDQSGRIVWSCSDLPRIGQIETSNLREGIYILSLHRKDGTTIHRRVIKDVF